MHFLMTALGSYGDVYPIVGLGSALCSRGHQVSMITNPYFQDVVETAGLEFVPLGSVAEYEAWARHEDLWHPIRGPRVVMQIAMEQYLRELYALVEGHVRPGETVLVAHILDLASRVYYDKYKVPLASVHLAPVGFRSFFESPQMFGMWMSSWAPAWVRKTQFWLADKIIDRLVGKELNALRQELGLAPVQRVMRQWYFSPQCVLGLFPDWFAPPQPDWLPQIQLTGFPLWDESLTVPLAAEVDQFLNGGEPPLVFAPGSANTQSKAFFSAAVEACRLLQRRGVLLSKYPDQVPASLPDSVQHFSFVPFSQLLPRVAALVHHGGIGTSAQGLAAALPQLVMPIAFDQLDNATRLQRLGVGTTLRPSKFTGANVARALDTLLSQEMTHEMCHSWALKMDGAASLAAACERLEILGGQDNRVSK
ncbi:MAG: glycosyltransferase [Pirellulales bacterium]|nr:glycosyltransferase [Pirellulales bacterium]